jgi:uncharacterized protein (DUF885 family)
MPALSDANPAAHLAAVADAYWDATMAFEPLFATQLGDRRFDRLLPDRSAAAIDAHAGLLASLRAELDRIDEAGLAVDDRVTHSVLGEQIASDLASLASGLSDWTVDPLMGPQIDVMDLESYQQARTPVEGRDLVARWQAIGSWLDGIGERLVAARETGRVAVASPVTKTIDGLGTILATDDADFAALAPARADHPDWPAAEVDAHRAEIAAAVSDVIRPALARFRATLVGEILPHARPDDRPGICHLAGGDAAYGDLIRVHTSLPLAARELHETGLAEVARIREELAVLGERVLGTSDVTEIQRRLRSDPGLHFDSRDAIHETAVRALARAEAAIPGWFGILPQAHCEVVRMGAHEEAHSTIAYYRQPAEDGSRAGRYYVNTSAPETRPRYEAEALAYHESIPGHHLQIAIGQELAGLPAFRRHLGPTAFFEGWGLYTERLSDEMGLYSGDLDRIGVLSFDAWRACRLVVDTGMHAFGWTRQQAIDYMVANTVLAENNVINEIDRYITWPGQALAYKSGQLEILRLRETARSSLGARFDIHAFHDVVLGAGAVPLETLRSRVAAWIGA